MLPLFSPFNPCFPLQPAQALPSPPALAISDPPALHTRFAPAAQEINGGKFFGTTCCNFFHHHTIRRGRSCAGTFIR